MLNTISCHCGEVIAASYHKDSEWNKKVIYYQNRGYTISVMPKEKVNFNDCKCIK